MKTRSTILIILAALLAFGVAGVASAQRDQRGEGRSGEQRNHPRIGLTISRQVVSAIKEATGLETREILALIADGKTLSEVVNENGGSTDAVKTGLLADLSERLETAVANERITQERADTLLANAAEQLDTLFERVFLRRQQQTIGQEI